MTAAAETLIEYERTDLGNALYFASEHRDLIRYDHRMKRWLIWSEHYWKPDYGPLLAQSVMAFVQNQFIEAATSEATLESRERRRTKHWGDANSARGMRAIAEIARNIPMLADDGKHWDEAPYLLGVPNGVVDLRTGVLRDGSPDDRITMQAKVPYDPSATAPRWERFLTEIHPDGEDGAPIRAYLHRAYGYSATGESREHIINFLTGTGRNGKSVERNAILHVLGDYGYSLPFEALEAVRGVRQSNDLAPLHRKRMAVSSEANRGVRLDTRRLKALTGEDPITARFLYGEFFEFLNTATIWVAVNDKPTVPDDSDGFWSRMRAIRYPVMFDGELADPTLNDTFANDEAVGILAWLVRGATAYYETGLGAIPASIQSATQAYREENDPVNEFIEAKCARHADAHASFNDVYREYLAWALEQGLSDRETLPRKTVRDYFKAHFRAWRNGSGRGFGGIRLLSQEAPATLGFERTTEEPAIPEAGAEPWQEPSWWEGEI